MQKYGETAKKEIRRAVKKYKRGELVSGKSGKRIRNPKQAIAVGISEARRKGGKIPKRKI